MDTFELIQRFSVALAIGLIIGLERGWQTRDEGEGERAAGLRTHALAALLGAVWGAIAQIKGDGGSIALGLAFLAFSAAIVLFRYRETARDGTFGATTVVAAMLAFTLGTYAVLGNVQVAAASGVAVAVLLALKAVLHAWVKRLTWSELRSGLVLLAMTFILLPLLPNRTVDPWGAINPFEIWLLTIVIAAISFVGYVALKLAGETTGILITGLAGGLASSTAVTVTLAKLAREHPEQRCPLIAGTLIAGATMMARVLVIVGLINAQLLLQLAWPIGLAAAVLVGLAVYLLRKPDAANGGQRPIALTNPFDLPTVLRFGAILAVITALAKVGTNAFGAAGAYALAFLSGIADVDAITLSMARLGGGTLGADVAAHAIAIAVAVNTLAKAGLGWMMGGSETGRRLVATAVIAIVAGSLGYLLGA